MNRMIIGLLNTIEDNCYLSRPIIQWTDRCIGYESVRLVIRSRSWRIVIGTEKNKMKHTEPRIQQLTTN